MLAVSLALVAETKMVMAVAEDASRVALGGGSLVYTALGVQVRVVE